MPPLEPAQQASNAANATTHDIQTVAFVSLGCPKNLVDSEKMFGLLAEDGLVPVSEDDNPDAIVINTCGFLEASKDESVDQINQAAERKRTGEIKRLVVAGCLVQRHRARMLDWCPDIDAMIGVYDRDHIVRAVRGGRDDNADELAADLPVYSSIATNITIAKQQRGIETNGYFESDAARLRLTPRHYAYLRISEGCNQNCSFCTIPSIRGKMRSKPVDAICSELAELINDGAFEINLIGQDTTSYGDDIGYGPGLVGMLTAINRTANDLTRGSGMWLRLMYAYPSCFTDEMIDAIADLPNIVKYIDMPLQHINDDVLTAMRRNTSRDQTETLLDKLRDRIPGIAIRTTFISGYPGETQAQHDELVDFIRDFGFDAMGVFGYSPEPGTPAGSQHASGHAIPDDVIAGRIDQLMQTQQAVAFEQNEYLAEQQVTLDVLIDRAAHAEVKPTAGVTDAARLHVGRAYHQAPDIDGLTYVQAAKPLAPGELVRCRIVAASGYDLIARPVEELDKTHTLNVLKS